MEDILHDIKINVNYTLNDMIVLHTMLLTGFVNWYANQKSSHYILCTKCKYFDSIYYMHESIYSVLKRNINKI